MPTIIHLTFKFNATAQEKERAINLGSKQILTFKEILKKLNISNAITNATKKAEIIKDNLKKENLECVSMNYQEYQTYGYARTAANFEKAIEQQDVNTKDLQESLYPQKIKKNVNLTVNFELN